MKNYLQPGRIIDIATPVGGLVSGQFYLLGALGGVAETTQAAGETVSLCREGVFTLPKATGETWAQGDQLYWDATNKKFTKTSSGNTKYGIANAAQVSGDTSGAVILDRP